MSRADICNGSFLGHVFGGGEGQVPGKVSYIRAMLRD